MATSRSPASRAYLIPMLLLVVIGTTVVAIPFVRTPVPPGIDPGHWLSIADSYVGLPTAPDPTDRAFYYAPLLFPFLGGLIVATGSPLVAADVFAVTLFATYGLSLVLLARRYLASGALQVALVGASVFSGSTVQMLFWGGYPNLLGFVLMNATLVVLVRFVRTQGVREGGLFYGLLALTYFGHDLSFAILLAAIAVSGVFLLVLRKVEPRFLLRPVNLVGVASLIGVIVAYSELTARLGIEHAGYLAANPTAYTVDEVGELFAPFGHAPVYLPPGGPVYLPPGLTSVALAAAPLVALVALALLRFAAPGRLDTRLVIAAGWLSAAFAVPGIGYLAHVDTDYTRFVYFLPLPFTLVLLAAVERAFLHQLVPRTDPSVADPSAAAASRRPFRRFAGRGRPLGPVTAGFSVAIVLGLLLVGVTIPAVQANQATSTAAAHDDSFVAASSWLKSYADSGNVLTVPSAARWTEALTQRDAYTVGPVWLLFAPFQITQAQESFWALGSQYVVTNNHASISYSGFATPVLSQAPMYSVYEMGVAFPVVRVLPGTLFVQATGPSGPAVYSLYGSVPPVVATPTLGATTIQVTYRCTAAVVVESGTVLPDGSARISFHVAPSAGFSVHNFGLTLAGPPAESLTMATGVNHVLGYANGTLAWSVVGRVGQYPTPTSLTTLVSFSEAPLTTATPSIGGPNAWAATFPDPNGSAPFGLLLHLATPDARNPTNAMPPMFSTQAFFATNGIHFLLWPNRAYGSAELTYFEATFGFQPVYENAEWVILEG